MGRKKKNRPKMAPRSPRRMRIDLRAPLLATAALAATTSAIAALGMLLDRPLKEIVIEGAFQRVTAIQIRAATEAHSNGGFLSANLDAVRRAVGELPWVDRVRVKRHWPDGIHVIVTEQVAAARWGETGLLNTRGELFQNEARHIPPELPSLHGPAGSETQVARRFLSLSRKLGDAGLRVRALRLDQRGAWRLTLDNGLELRLGRERTDQRLELFVQVVLPMIEADMQRIDHVDLRYARGFAIGWRSSGSVGLLAGTEELSDV